MDKAVLFSAEADSTNQPDGTKPCAGVNEFYTKSVRIRRIAPHAKASAYSVPVSHLKKQSTNETSYGIDHQDDNASSPLNYKPPVPPRAIQICDGCFLCFHRIGSTNFS